MRTSNILVSKGSIFFANFSQVGDLSFMNNRPLIAVTYPTGFFNTITVCSTGSRDTPGINASFFNYYDNKYLGGNEISHIFPHTLHTIYISQIRNIIGVLDRFTMDEVDKAIQYFNGTSRELPEYLKELETELTGVSSTAINFEKVSISPRYHAGITGVNTNLSRECALITPPATIRTELPPKILNTDINITDKDAEESGETTEAPPVVESDKLEIDEKVEAHCAHIPGTDFVDARKFVRDKIQNWKAGNPKSLKYKRIGKIKDDDLVKTFSRDVAALVMSRNLAYSEFYDVYGCGPKSVSEIINRLRTIFTHRAKTIISHYDESVDDQNKSALRMQIFKLDDAYKLGILMMVWSNSTPDNLSPSAIQVLEYECSEVTRLYDFNKTKWRK